MSAITPDCGRSCLKILTAAMAAVPHRQPSFPALERLHVRSQVPDLRGPRREPRTCAHFRDAPTFLTSGSEVDQTNVVLPYSIPSQIPSKFQLLNRSQQCLLELEQ